MCVQARWQAVDEGQGARETWESVNNKYYLLSCVAVVVEQEVEENRDGDDDEDDDDDHCGIYYTHTHLHMYAYFIVYMSFTLRGSICFV